MRAKALVFTLAMTFAMMTGCAQRFWISDQDYNQFHARTGLPLGAERDPYLSVKPTTDFREKPPAIIDEPEREPRYISLAECIAIALEKGSVGIQSVRQPGAINEDLLPALPLGSTQITSNTDSIRVFTLNPASAGAAIDAALARFDAKWVTSFATGTTDQPIQGFNSFSNGDNGRLVSTLVKPLPTGGLAAATFSTLYQDLTSPPTNFPLRNPAFTPRLQFTFEHSLWQSFGIDVNQVLSRPPLLGNLLSQIHPEASQYYGGHPLNQQNQGAGSNFNPTGILITRTRFDQTRADLERVVNFQLYNVEVAYWNLYGAYISLYTAEQALRFGHETYRLAQLKYESGKEGFTLERVAQSRGQFEQFRGDRLVALGNVLEAERVLRSFLGLPPEDGQRLVPVDAPTLAPFVPNWETALEEALTLRPELVLARQELRSLQMNILVQQNFLKPDLRFVSQFGINGLGSRLDGDSQFFDQTIGRFRSDNALRSLASTHYNDWSLGLTMNVPIGFRFEHAAVRAAQLQLAQGFLAVQREEQKAKLFLTKAYRDVFQKYKEVGARRAQREAYAEQLQARFQLFRAGREQATIEFVLQAQQQWANALNQEYQAVVAYNNALAAFQFAKGTIMLNDNVVISEGAIPQCAQVRAVEHERQRSQAIVLRERANPLEFVPPTADHGVPWMPHLSRVEAPAVPALMDRERLPVPEKLDEAPPVAPRPRAVEPKQVLSAPPAVAPKAPESKELHFTRPAVEPKQVFSGPSAVAPKAPESKELHFTRPAVEPKQAPAAPSTDNRVQPQTTPTEIPRLPEPGVLPAPAPMPPLPATPSPYLPTAPAAVPAAPSPYAAPPQLPTPGMR